MTESPTAPKPYTMQLDPGVTLELLIAAPQPVDTPHPRTHTRFKFAKELILAALISAITEYSLKVEHPIK